MIDLFGLLFSSLFVYLCGFSLINFSSRLRRLEILEKIGYSYGIGVGALTLTLFVYSLLHISWNVLAVLSPWVIVCCVSYKVHAFPRQWKWKKKNPTKKNLIFCILLLITSLYVLFEALVRPLPSWDGWATWYFLGKAFYLNKSLIPQIYMYGHFEAPPLIPLLVSYTYLMIGKVNDTLSLFNLYLFYINILILLFAYLKKYTSLFNAFLFTLLFATLPVVIRHGGRYDIGHVDLPLSYYFFCSVLLWRKFLLDKTLVILFLLEFFIGVGALIKNEGTTFFIIMQIMLFAWIAYKRIMSKKLLSIYFFGGIPLLLWVVFKKYYHIPSIYLLSDSFHLERFGNVLFLVLEEFIHIGRWNLLWPVFFIFLLYSFYKKDLKNALLLLPISLQFFVYMYIYMITTGDRDYVTQIHGTIDRLLLHLVPVIVLWVGIKSYNFFTIHFNGKKI